MLFNNHRSNLALPARSATSYAQPGAEQHYSQGPAGTSAAEQLLPAGKVGCLAGGKNNTAAGTCHCGWRLAVSYVNGHNSQPRTIEHSIALSNLANIVFFRVIPLMKGHIYDFSGILSSYNGHDGVWPCSVMPGWVDFCAALELTTLI